MFSNVHGTVGKWGRVIPAVPWGKQTEGSKWTTKERQQHREFLYGSLELVNQITPLVRSSVVHIS